MTKLLVVVVILLVIQVFLLAFFVIKANQYQVNIVNAISGMPKSTTAQTEPFVTSSAPELTNELAAGNSATSVIVTPKSPALIAWEESQEIAKMNMGRPH